VGQTQTWFLIIGRTVRPVVQNSVNRMSQTSSSFCALWNGAMESDADMAEKARHYGHKLRSWQDPFNPVCDIPSGRWYRLTSDGGKVETVEDDIPF
jgi:hypothetical protein